MANKRERCEKEKKSWIFFMPFLSVVFSVNFVPTKVKKKKKELKIEKYKSQKFFAHFCGYPRFPSLFQKKKKTWQDLKKKPNDILIKSLCVTSTQTTTRGSVSISARRVEYRKDERLSLFGKQNLAFTLDSWEEVVHQGDFYFSDSV